jgi:excisionase family DNA binding protein
MFEKYNDVVTVEELAEMLKIGRNTAYKLLTTDQIPSVRVGRQRRIRKADIQRFLLNETTLTEKPEVEAPTKKCYNSNISNGLAPLSFRKENK